MKWLMNVRVASGFAILLVFAWFLGGCGSSGGGSSSGHAGGQTPAGAARLAEAHSRTGRSYDFTVFVVLGDSLSEGYQDGDANFYTQYYSYANQVALQIGTYFPLPYIAISNKVSYRLQPWMEAHNLGVGGATAHSLLTVRSDAPTQADFDSETDIVLFPRNNGVTQLDAAEAMKPTFAICWIGGNDVLDSVNDVGNLDEPFTQLTKPDAFRRDYSEIMRRMKATGAGLVTANLPDVTTIAFLFSREEMNLFLERVYGLPPHLVPPLLVPDGTYVPLPKVVEVAQIMKGVRPGDIANVFRFDGNVLDAAEMALIRQRTAELNAIIRDVASQNEVPVVDIHGFLRGVEMAPVPVGGKLISTTYQGGLFSLDGIHPSDVGHSLIANRFIETINNFYGSSIPAVDAEKYLWDDPFVDRDGDGFVEGFPFDRNAFPIPRDCNDRDPRIFPGSGCPFPF
jgi:lysophospholipase L1-like esterase